MKYLLTETDTCPCLLNGLALWWERRRQRNDLSGIELRTLRDLGLTRSWSGVRRRYGGTRAGRCGVE
jgi:Domain of unknown function (DUF1127)